MYTKASIENFMLHPTILELPYYGLNKAAGKAFALDQYAVREGYNRFSEWFSEEARDKHHVLIHVLEADDISLTDKNRNVPATHGYELNVHRVNVSEGVETETRSIVHPGVLMGLASTVRNGILLEQFAHANGYSSFPMWFVEMSNRNIFVSAAITDHLSEGTQIHPRQCTLFDVGYIVSISLALIGEV